jgi:hypothetical protein
MARRRGQAALEFLSTYGFAFLLILVMIGALSYFGILSPQKFLPGRCLVSNEFSCADRIITRTPTGATMNLVLVNNLGNQITFQNGDARFVANSTFGNGACTAAPTALTSGARSTITCTLTGTFPAAGEKAKISYNIVYTELGGTYNRVVGGEVADTIQ